VRIGLIAAMLAACGGGSHGVPPGADASGGDAGIDSATIDAPVCSIMAGSRCITELPIPNVKATSPDALYAIVPAYCDAVHQNCSQIATRAKTAAALVISCPGEAIAGGGASFAIQGLIAYGTQQWGPAVYTCAGASMNIMMGWSIVPARSPSLVGAYGGHVYLEDAGNLYDCSEANGCGASPSAVATGVPAMVFNGADSAGVYFSDGASIYVYPSGGTGMTILSGATQLAGFSVADQIWFATATAVESCPKTASACTPSPLYAGATAIAGLYADAQDVYWIDAGNLVRCPTSGCTTPELIYATGDPSAVLFAGDDTNVYCTGPGSTTLQVPK
jgi:hypothetical protein